METICSVEPNQFPHKPMIVDQEASHHRRANQTSPQHTLPYQTDDTLTIDMYHTNATQCIALPRHAISHCTKIKVPLPPCFFSQEEFLSCRLFYVPPLDLFPSKISFFASVICCFFWWTTLKYPFIYYSKWLAFFPFSRIVQNSARASARQSKPYCTWNSIFRGATCRSFFYLIFSFLCLHVWRNIIHTLPKILSTDQLVRFPNPLAPGSDIQIHAVGESD